MTVISVKTLTTRDGTQQEQHDRTYTMRYLVETSLASDGAQTILTSPSVPQAGAYYIASGEFDLGARVVDRRLSHVDGDPKLWHLEVVFSNRQREDPDDRDPQSPDEREPTIRYRFEKRQIPLIGNYDDTANGKLQANLGVCNSLNQPFSPPPMIEETYPVLTLYRDDLVLAMSDIFAIQDSINSTAFSGAAAETLKLNVVDVEERFEDGKRLWRKHYELVYNKRTWTHYLLDYGYKQDDDGNWRQVLLDGAGNEATATTPHYDSYDPYKKTEFRNIPAIAFLAAESL